MITVVVAFLFISATLTTDAVPVVRDAASTVTDIACSIKIPLANFPDLKNFQKCLAEHNKDSQTIIKINSVRIDDQSRQLNLRLSGEPNGKTIQLRCQSNQGYLTTANTDVSEFDCHPHAKLIVRGLVKNRAELTNREELSTNKCSKRSYKICSFENKDWGNCPYTETELRPSDADFEALGKKCLMIGDTTGRFMYDACGNLDCLWCRPFSNYDPKTRTCLPCATGGLPFPTPPIGDSCRAVPSNSMIAVTSLVRTTQTTTTATIAQTTSTVTENEDLPTPGMHNSPYFTMEFENSATTDVSTENHNRFPEETTNLIKLLWISAIVGITVALCWCWRKNDES